MPFCSLRCKPAIFRKCGIPYGIPQLLNCQVILTFTKPNFSRLKSLAQNLYRRCGKEGWWLMSWVRLRVKTGQHESKWGIPWLHSWLHIFCSSMYVCIYGDVLRRHHHHHSNHHHQHHHHHRYLLLFWLSIIRLTCSLNTCGGSYKYGARYDRFPASDDKSTKSTGPKTDMEFELPSCSDPKGCPIG